MDSNLFDAALQLTATTWKAYTVAICILFVTLMIDMLSGFSFLKGKTPIDLAGFKIVREALSATYGLVFSSFVATVFLESRLLKSRSSATNLSTSNASSVLDLWFLSPFSASGLLRTVFWILFIYGFLLLAIFSCVHLARILPPDPNRMSSAKYVAIGAGDLVLLVICAPFGYWTYQNFQHVRSVLP